MLHLILLSIALWNKIDFPANKLMNKKYHHMANYKDLYTYVNKVTGGEDKNFNDGNTQRTRENRALGDSNTQQDREGEDNEIEQDEQDTDSDANTTMEYTLEEVLVYSFHRY